MKIDPSTDVTELDDAELAMAHVKLHSHYRRLRRGRDEGEWDTESVIETHEEMRDEMEARRMGHTTLDGLDNDDIEVKQLLPHTEPKVLNDDELTMAHAELHSYYKDMTSGRSVEDWDMESLVETHREIRQELEDRGLPHPELNDLDEERVEQKLEPKLEPVKNDIPWTDAHLSFVFEVAQYAQAADLGRMSFKVDPDTDALIISSLESDELTDDQVALVQALAPVEVAGMTAPGHEVVDVEDYR